MCQGDSACLLPIAASAVHTNPTGSRLAIRHFTEYLEQFPENLEVRWLLNLAHMTLGEYPDKVDPRFRLDLIRFFHSEFDIGRVPRGQPPGGPGRPDEPVRRRHHGRLRQRRPARHPDHLLRPDPEHGVLPQHGRRHLRGPDEGGRRWPTSSAGWSATRPTTTTTDCSTSSSPAGPGTTGRCGRACCTIAAAAGSRTSPQPAGLLDPVNSNAAAWADYDNDGLVDLFVACERQPNRLYRNKGNGTFEEVAARAGVAGDPERFAKGCTWLDYDNDGFPDLFVNNLLR